MRTIDVRTDRRTEFVEITGDVRRVVREAGLADGAVIVYCPHTSSNRNYWFSSGFSRIL
ncbi:MAG TPA: hypothetical protein VH092_23305 [Urbifossiella sp.]|jgi:thiamine phosphate synthase YjbQ (UPF0047 family)|nr:hypothetical protein [Urbifossiella sp.]